MNITDITKTPYQLYHYAQYVLKAQWPQAEPYIAKDPAWAYRYALNIIGGRWKEAEHMLMNSKFRSDYIDFVLNSGNISEHERTLFQLQYSEYLSCDDEQQH